MNIDTCGIVLRYARASNKLKLLFVNKNFNNACNDDEEILNIVKIFGKKTLKYIKKNLYNMMIDEIVSHNNIHALKYLMSLKCYDGKKIVKHNTFAFDISQYCFMEEKDHNVNVELFAFKIACVCKFNDIADYIMSKSNISIYLPNRRDFIAEYCECYGGFECAFSKYKYNYRELYRYLLNFCFSNNFVASKHILSMIEKYTLESDDNVTDHEYHRAYVFGEACARGMFGAAKWLYSTGFFNINSDDNFSFVYSCSNGHLEIAKWLYSFGSIDIDNYYDHIIENLNAPCDVYSADDKSINDVIEWLSTFKSSRTKIVST